MKKVKSILSILIVAMLVFMTCPISVSAAYSTADLINLEDAANISVVIEYTKSKPGIIFITPGNEEWKTDNENITVVESGKRINYQIRNAAAGQWKIKYDKKDNPELDFSAAVFNDGLWINDVTIGKVENDNIPVKFTATHGSDIGYNFEVSVITDPKSVYEGSKVIFNGYATANEEVSVKPYLGGLSTYSKYYVCVTVYYEGYNGTKVSDYAVSKKSFSYTNANTPEAITDFNVLVTPSDGTLHVEWKETGVSCEKYVVGLFDASNLKAPIGYLDVAEDICEANFIINPDKVKKYKVSISYIKNGVTSAACEKTFDIGCKNPVATIDTAETTNANQVTISYTTNKAITAVVGVGDKESTITLKKGSSVVSANLNNGTNDVYFIYPIADGVKLKLKKEVNVDKIAPKLTLYENLNRIVTTDSTYTIVGEVESGSTVTIGGVAVTLDKNNCINHEVKLNSGENLIKIDVKDLAGNVTSQFISIEYKTALSAVNITEDGVKEFLPLIITCALSIIAAIVFVVLMKRKSDKDERKSLKFLKISMVVFTVFAAIDAGLLVWRVISRIKLGKLFDSYEFFEIVKTSFDDAYNKIETYNAMIKEIIVLAVLLVIFVALAIVCGVLLKKVKTMPPKAPKENVNIPKPEKREKFKFKDAVAGSAVHKGADNISSIKTEPIQTEPVKAEPVKAEPAKTEPAKTETVKAEPVKAEPVKAEPVKTEPVKTEPVKVESHEKAPTVGKAFFCPYCGAKYNSKPKFCGSCGKSIPN